MPAYTRRYECPKCGATRLVGDGNSPKFCDSCGEMSVEGHKIIAVKEPPWYKTVFIIAIVLAVLGTMWIASYAGGQSRMDLRIQRAFDMTADKHAMEVHMLEEEIRELETVIENFKQNRRVK